MRAVEVTTPADAVSSVLTNGVAIWRGLIPPEVAIALEPYVESNVENVQSYVSLKFGVLNLAVLPPPLQRQCTSPEIRATFDLALGPNEINIREIYVTVPGYYQPHPWHQDANEKNQEYHFMCWVACTACGMSAPGLSFAMPNPGKYIGGEFEDFISRGYEANVISPIFAPGDAFFFDCHSVHKTNVHPAMTMSRIAYKLGARAVGKEIW